MTRQLVRSVTTPPTTKPLAPAAAPAALQAATARCRSTPSAVIVVSRRNADGTAVAAAPPWTQRAAVSTTTDVDAAARTAPAADATRLSMITRR